MKRSFSTVITYNNGVKTPQLGFGTVRLADDDEGKKAAILKAIEVGYRKFDTAARYQSEKALGEAIKESGVPREEFFIGTKIAPKDLYALNVKEAFEESLKLLQTDYVDLYMIHWPVPCKWLKGWNALQDIYRSGKAKAIGVSNFNIPMLETLYERTEITPAVNQIEFHPFYQRRKLYEYMRAHNIKLEAFQPLGNGRYFDNAVINEIAGKHGKKPGQVVLRWELQSGVIPIPRSSKMEHIKENMDLFDFELDSDDMYQIECMNIERTIAPDDPTCIDNTFFGY